MADWLNLVNQIIPMSIGIACAFGVYRNLMESSLAIWTPMPWFLAACAAYYGFGPLVFHYGNEESIAYINMFYSVDEIDLMWTNILNIVGILCIIASYYVFYSAYRRDQDRVTYEVSDTQLLRLMYFFLAVGFLVDYAFVMSYRLGLLSWTLPGAIQSLSKLSKMAIILLFVLVHKGYKYYRYLLFGVVAMEVVLTFMTFSKQAVIELLIAIGLGWYLVRSNVRGLLLGGVAIVLLYVFFLSPFMSFARIAAQAVGVGTASEVSDVVMEYQGVKKDDLAGLIPGVQGWWTRLSYSNAQAFAMSEYDKGSSGDSLQLIYYAFLPRLLFPDKPLMTPGREFTAIVTGEETETATSPGIFAEAYWNGGWIAVVFVCLYVGMLYAGFTVFAERTISEKKYEYLPIVMAGLAMGYQPNDWFVGVFVGTLANVIAMYFLMRYAVMPMLMAAGPRNMQAGSTN